MNVSIEESWKTILNEEFSKDYFINLTEIIKKDRAEGIRIFPPGPLIFNAFNKTPFDKVRVVIIGQDPYHRPGQAHGLSFSVPDGIKPPPSLINIYKELKEDIGLSPSSSGNLERWTSQGVFLLNAILTVRAGEAASHRKIGWELFTDAVIKILSDKKEGLIFLLWGNFARGKKSLIDQSKHHILEAAHPSPLAGGAFFGCRHFSKTNEILRQQGNKEIKW
jgi:uracil-DNA glycosylase